MPGSAKPVCIDLTEESGGPASPPAVEAEQPASPAAAAAVLPSAAPSVSQDPSNNSPAAPSQSGAPLPADPVVRLSGPTASQCSPSAAAPAPLCNHPNTMSEASQQAKRRRTSMPTASQATEQMTAQRHKPRQALNMQSRIFSRVYLAQRMRASHSTAPARPKEHPGVWGATAVISGQGGIPGPAQGQMVPPPPVQSLLKVCQSVSPHCTLASAWP